MPEEINNRFRAAGRRLQAIYRRIWYGRSLERPTYHISSTLFLRLLGVVYLIAFWSLWTQIDGLIGSRGIVPAWTYLNSVEQFFANADSPVMPAWKVPTLCWISAGDRALNCLCLGGMFLSILLISGVLPIQTLVLSWLFYLSLLHVGSPFLSFQWDILLLETGFLAIFVAPFALRSIAFGGRHPPRLALFLVWWLLFRLMFESGAVKLTWNDAYVGADGLPLVIANTWESLTAMDHQYWTQPLPIWTSWYAAKLPTWFQKFSVVSVLIIEMGLPLLIFGPRFMRLIAFGGFTLLMLLIGATGNYTFFNLLTFALCLTLVDDRVWPDVLRNRITRSDPPEIALPFRWRYLVLVPFAALALCVGAHHVWRAVDPPTVDVTKPRIHHPTLLNQMDITQFMLVNEYGLFRRMTEARPEIVIEGSDDGGNWQEYKFRWKPGDLDQAPGFNTPHQPRLDWQMWFEALDMERYWKQGSLRRWPMSGWFRALLYRLGTGQPEVLELLGDNPFPDAPPQHLRIVLYQYRFTTSEERDRTGDWWHRDRVANRPISFQQ